MEEALGVILHSVSRCRLLTCPELSDAAPVLAGNDVALLLLHVRGGDGAGVRSFLERLTAERPGVPTLVVCEEYDATLMLDFLRVGATECLARPLDLRRLQYLIDSLTLNRRYGGASRAGPDVGAATVLPEEFGSFCCRSLSMQEVIRRVRCVAPEKISVLLTGETGAGKTRLARLIHDLSPRRDEPFVAVNCGALPETLVESELFGHRKGAFTGADVENEGRFAAAGAGTILLDEVDSLSLAVQAKLLHAVDQRVFQPVGGTKPQQLRARLLFATNKTLAAEVDAGRFRADLYYRLNAAEVELPPLRERRGEIRPLIDAVLGEWREEHDGAAPAISADALLALESYHWPGNIRELRHVLQQTLVFCPSDEVFLRDLPPRLQAAVGAEPFAGPVAGAAGGPVPQRQHRIEPDSARPVAGTVGRNAARSVAPSVGTACGERNGRSDLAHARFEGEARRVREVLVETGNNRSEAAGRLGISRTALYKKLHMLGLM